LLFNLFLLILLLLLLLLLLYSYNIDHINKKTAWHHPDKLNGSSSDTKYVDSDLIKDIEPYQSIITSTNYLNYVSNGNFHTSLLNLSQFKRGVSKKDRSNKKTLAFSQCMARINPTPLEKKTGKYSGSISISEMKSNHHLVSNIARISSPLQDMQCNGNY
jgi:hypothetical protein